jgi:DNA polymerase V
MQISEILPLRRNSKQNSYLASVAVSAGIAAETSTDIELFDFNEHLTNGRDGVYLIRVVGDSMENEIFHGDLLIVNRNLQAQTGDKIIASVNGSFTVKTFTNAPSGLRLVASNGKYKERKIHRNDNFEIFGVVTHVVRNLKKN